MKQELERELQAEEIKRQMQDVRQGMQDTENQLRASGEALRREAQQAQRQGDELVQEYAHPRRRTFRRTWAGLPRRHPHRSLRTRRDHRR